jgi:hypothetical protein
MMGEAKRHQYSRAKFLTDHTKCAYCGQDATTTDHCPPRCFFKGRHWPEGCEFPACQKCNDETRLDEQGLALLIRVDLNQPDDSALSDEWVKLAKGVANNQPELLRDWSEGRPTERKRLFRKAFGKLGDDLRQDGWTAIKIDGPVTQAMIDRFLLKLAKAIYYRHTNNIFNGVLYTRFNNSLFVDNSEQFISSILSITPNLVFSTRNKVDLSDQFFYRYNLTPENDVMFAAGQLGRQFIFETIALSPESNRIWEEHRKSAGKSSGSFKRTDCIL